MAKYRKKPIVIEAEQWPRPSEAQPPAGQQDTLGVVWEYGPDGKRAGGRIGTLEGPHHVTDGDWIITGIQGEQYPCKPDIFDATYEPVD